MAAVVRAMTLSQNYHPSSMNNCIVIKGSPDTPPPSSAGSPPLMINSMPMHHHTMIGKRTIAPAMGMQQQQHHHQQIHHHQMQQHQQIMQSKGSSAAANAPVIRFNGSDIKNTCLPKTSAKRLTTSTSSSTSSSQYTTGPMPSVERRNARERNRVKQVNNGFDKLRQYIPTKIVEAENGGRGVSKKLSKVDTLKLAVKYIQRMKEMLEDNDSRMATNSHAASEVSSSTSSYYSASPAPSTHHTAMHMTYASTPISSYQENPHLTTACSEPSVSPAPSYHSDVSSHHPHSVYQMQTVQFSAVAAAEEAAAAAGYPRGYSEVQFEDEDSGSFEEEGILDDILQWQLQN